MAAAYGISPEHSKSAVNRAGKKVRQGCQSDEDVAIIENWRASHNYILNTFQANLRKRIKRSGLRVGFGQRIKRRATIFDKLRRQDGMNLSRMHDIAGCRLIFENEGELRQFRKEFHSSRFLHERKVKKSASGEIIDPYDYIERPRDTGYRGIHDVFEYKAQYSGGEPWNGLQLEIQYRTIYQHAWATSVEVCDSLTENRGKFDQADESYQNFFRVCSELIARYYEGRSSCLSERNNEDLIAEFHDVEQKLRLFRTISGIRQSFRQFKFRKHVLLIFKH